METISSVSNGTTFNDLD